MNIFRQKSRLAKWYLIFLTIIVLSFATLTFIHLYKNQWETFQFAVNLFCSEMYEEVTLYRNDLNITDFEEINWTDDMLAEFRYRVAQEIIDETIDNKLKDFGLVRIRNLHTGRTLFESDEVKKYHLQFEDDYPELWGFNPFQFTYLNKNFEGLGYLGYRINTHYFVATVFENGINIKSKSDLNYYNDIVYNVANSVLRDGFDLYINEPDSLGAYLKNRNAWAYCYLFEQDSVLWVSNDTERKGLYLPIKYSHKDYFADIQDSLGNKYKQYTEIHDKVPGCVYTVDVAVPIKSVQFSILKQGIIILSSAVFLIVISWGGGIVITKRALTPVNKVIERVNDITSKNLDIRLPIPEIDDEIARLVITFNDLLDRLAAAFRLHKTFIADASHELRTPLSILMGEIEMASKIIINKPLAQRNLREAALEIEHMARIVDDLQWLARGDAGQIYIEKKNIRLDEVLMNTLSRCQILAAKNDIKLNIDRIEILEYTGDEGLLIRALGNLVNNAIKYSNPGGTVTLSLYKNTKYVTFNVKDNGVGIPKDSLNKIFDRFYRVDVSRSRETGGSGLGLSITKWIVDLHNGEIKVESVESKGSVFSINLPV
ncbi:HAMP domain-containing protein [candidate division KSB1 bacterium]|nr:HAMP domain-containing protein [candidate division KSB1 bacterium]